MNAQNAPWGGIAVVECAPLNTKQSERDLFWLGNSLCSSSLILQLLFELPCSESSLSLTIFPSCRAFFWIFFILARWFWNQTCAQKKGNPVFSSRCQSVSTYQKISIFSLANLISTNLHNSDTETGVLAEGLAHFSARFWAELEGGLERPPLLGCQYCPGPFGTASPIVRTS